MKFGKFIIAIVSFIFVNSSQIIAHAEEQSRLSSPLLAKKLEQTQRHIQELEALKVNGHSDDSVRHMKHLMLHKIEFTRSGKVSDSFQLVARKVAENSDDLNRLQAAEGLPQEMVSRIRNIVLHKLEQMKDVTYFSAL
ncbi:MAG: hypothetical protein CO186_04685 [Zetaproteobacteria bacterium CG_4_9_14_3_um_filter_49_83]|nr:MAG: hypothetical protein AUJ56_00650 [Zetaproteobacteria bacterium CG1_02_49_23]PIQ31504.1 MAG: hypothetical protein COW62_09570 [Zetaproteobacteria bacterium CG17_big_fil_post_rev_8_21_14_2_50_50_13]PIV29439.1 MAG: hypothetical protein COS35_12070 [Zetaproteobacteria bacterium CG02_land_8_20_14_3_00_50_9]PIY54617.1 MAG: hypothetical protein COZ00_13795 [Zetaproteobacteria bacterium CG_4_10_14_0_8_um_filter_49_80]PJA35653.1 MAG: hypothetical protein CO186_04685 [Zetaproteobacteria bacterium